MNRQHPGTLSLIVMLEIRKKASILCVFCCYIPYVVLTYGLDSSKWTREMNIDCHVFLIRVKIVEVPVCRVGQPGLICL
jgi:hypothetical protein